MFKYKHFYTHLYENKVAEHFADYKSVPVSGEDAEWFINGDKRAILTDYAPDLPKLKAFIKKNNYPHRMIKLGGVGKHLVATKTMGDDGEKELDTVENLGKHFDEYLFKKTKPEEEYHTTLGKFLGYSDEDIKKFIDRKKTNTLPPQK